jgi:hypothetical protein
MRPNAQPTTTARRRPKPPPERIAMSPKPEQPDAEGSQGEGTLLSHLFELRNRLLRIVLAILVVFLALFPFANKIYTLLAGPLMVHLPEGSSMIAIEVAAPFLIPFKLVLLLAVVLTIPTCSTRCGVSWRRVCTVTRNAWRCRWWSPAPCSSMRAWPSPTSWSSR